jgi:sterol desaturase/sphingolipid hydroxylase (fatty acid hydroxylase superfamily)
MTYYITSFVFFYNDMFNPNQEDYNKIIKVYSMVTNQVQLNILVVAPIFLYIIHLSDIQPQYNMEFSCLNTCFDIMLFAIVLDAIFYTNHRLLHTKYLYYIHKWHHKLTEPVGFGALYCHPIEMVVGNLIPVITPIYIFKTHLLTILIWFMITTFNTIVSHSEHGISNKFHDKHHTKNKNNFGTIGLFDVIFRTYK